MHNIIPPGRVLEQEVRGQGGFGQEIPVGFVHDQPDASFVAQSGEAGDDVRRIDGAGGVVGADQHDRSRAIRQQGGGAIRVGDEPVLGEGR